ncbi:MAG: hypothetical protein KC776_37625, partial [Myxococcales bacterium]|nr:hypothetical protein [Myxococcales bacterium]
MKWTLSIGLILGVAGAIAACSSDDGGKSGTGGTDGGIGGFAAAAGTGAAGAGGTGAGGSGGTATASCQGNCGSADPVGDPGCYCDSQCQNFGDCCDDFASVCGGTGGGGGGTVTLPAGCVTGGITVNCNPVTNEGCDTAGGAACDLGQSALQC